MFSGLSFWPQYDIIVELYKKTLCSNKNKNNQNIGLSSSLPPLCKVKIKPLPADQTIKFIETKIKIKTKKEIQNIVM